jgi:hypothetical protein
MTSKGTTRNIMPIGAEAIEIHPEEEVDIRTK